MIDFKTLISLAGSEEGARILFEKLITSIVKLKHKEARSIRPNPGDWGIDTYLGELNDRIFVWQAKYFINGIENSQKSNIRESFQNLIKNSIEHSFKVDVWTLCIPCSLSAKETQWWENWKKKKEKENKIKIMLWDDSDLRDHLDSPDAQFLKLGYFGTQPSIANFIIERFKDEDEPKIHKLPDPDLYEESLFIKKLKAAGFSLLTSAKTEFFNAELLTQEIYDKGDTSEINSLEGLQEKLRSIWETRFNETFRTGQFELIYSDVMKVVEDYDDSKLQVKKIMASFVHKKGVLHQLANICEIGWTRDFQKLGISEE